MSIELDKKLKNNKNDVTKEIPEDSKTNDKKIMNVSDEPKDHTEKSYIKVKQKNPFIFAQKLKEKEELNMKIKLDRKNKEFLYVKNNITSTPDSKHKNGIRLQSEKKKTLIQKINSTNHNHKYLSMPKSKNIEIKNKNKIKDEDKIAPKTKKSTNSSDKKVGDKKEAEKNTKNPKTEEKDEKYILFTFNQNENASLNNKVKRIQSRQKTIKQIKNESLIEFPLKRKCNSLSKIKNKKIIIKMEIKQKNEANSKIDIKKIPTESKIEHPSGQEKQDVKTESNLNKYTKITEKIIEEKIKTTKNYDEIIKDINNLLINQPIIKKIVEMEYFTEDDFQIMNEKNADKFPFIINLKNYLNILNAIYYCVEKNPLLFHKSLKLIKSKFSFAIREEDIIDFGFLARTQSIIYNYILSKGETGFQDKKLKDLAKYYYEENKVSLGHLYEESNKIYLLNEIENENYEEFPDIIYYLNEKGVGKLFKDKLLLFPTQYKLKDTKDNGTEFSGYNELDICFKIKKDVKIEQNNNFNIVKLPKTNVIKKYNPMDKKLIEFEKDTIYFVEVKKNPNDLDNAKIKETINKSKTFLQFYKNNAYTGEKDDNIIKYENIFICDNKRENIVRKFNLYNKSNKEIKMIYSDKNISLNAITSLNSCIYELNVKNNLLEKNMDSFAKNMTKLEETIKNDKIQKDREINELNAKMGSKDFQINDLNTKMENKDNEIKDLNEKMKNKDNQINDFNKTIKNMQNKIANMEMEIQDLQIKNANSISIKENYSRLVDILNSITITQQLVSLYLKSLYNENSNLSSQIMEHISYLFNECAIEFFKLNDECINISGIIIACVQMDRNNNELKKRIYD